MPSNTSSTSTIPDTLDVSPPSAPHWKKASPTQSTVEEMSFEPIKQEHLNKGPYKWTRAIGYAVTAGAAVMGIPIPELTIPFLAEGAALVAGALAGVKGFLSGKAKWNRELMESEQAFEKASGNCQKQADIVADLEEKDSSFINKIPLVGPAVQWLAKKAEKYQQELLVADVSAGVGIAVGYKVGALIGTIIAPGVGTLAGSLIGAAVGAGAGMFFGAKIGSYLKEHKERYDQFRSAMLSGIVGAGLGGATGALIGSLVFPGIGTAAGAAIGAGVGAVGGIVHGALTYNQGSFLKEHSRKLSVSSGASAGVAIGGIIGSFLPLPGVGTALGALVGGVIGAGVTWGLTKYGNYLSEQKTAAKAAFLNVPNIVQRKLSPKPDHTPQPDAPAPKQWKVAKPIRSTETTQGQSVIPIAGIIEHTSSEMLTKAPVIRELSVRVPRPDLIIGARAVVQEENISQEKSDNAIGKKDAVKNERSITIGKRVNLQEEAHQKGISNPSAALTRSASHTVTSSSASDTQSQSTPPSPRRTRPL
jgi:hypothetical protein